MSRSFAEIKERLSEGRATVLTAQEVCELAEEGQRLVLKDVDVVTTATRAVMSGTYAVFSFPAGSSCTFSRAKKVWMNGVPAFVGPCPNERLSLLDLMVFGTAHSEEDPRYGGGHLFRDLVDGERIRVRVEAKEREFSFDVSLEEMPHARLFGTRHAFKNYSAFVNPGDQGVSTIFHPAVFPAHLTGCTFSGCGQLSPLKGDPFLQGIGVGTRILLNGAQGFVIGHGTRSSPNRPNLSGFADMHGMKAEYLGGFVTSAGPECIVSWALPIPVLNQSILDALAIPDREIPLPVMDVESRQQIDEASYGDVWAGRDLEVKFTPQDCLGCQSCKPVELCPTRAISFIDGSPRLDRSLCFNCGLCCQSCGEGVFSADLGAVLVGGVQVPVVCRQSDRLRALKLAEELKLMILEGSFQVTEPVERIA